MLSRFFTALGLALLYASGYFWHLLSKQEIYFLPSVWHYIFWPTLIVVFVLTPVILAGARIHDHLPASRKSLVLALSALALFSLLAIKSALDAADYPWTSIVFTLAGSGASLLKMRLMEVGLTIGTVSTIGALAYFFRDRWRSWLHFLSLLGYAFLVLAIVRIDVYPKFSSEAAASSQPFALPPFNGTDGVKPSRQVVWIIFDEMDYGESLGDSAMRAKLPNFVRLTAEAVSAQQAYSPARDTEASVPALLTGQPVSGMHFRGKNELDLIAPNGSAVPFIPEKSIFARLPAGPRSASILGYYHPYCEIFKAVGTCRSFYLGNAGRWFDGLTNFSQTVFSAGRWVDGFVDVTPEILWRNFDPMFRITNDTLEALPGILAGNNRALIYIHLNLPHLPGGYAQKEIGMPQTADDHIVYKENLQTADRILGRIIGQLEKQAKNQKILLIVSSDHWHRLDSPQQARPIPFIAWDVGESRGIEIAQPISTVHTADLALDFLGGKITSPAEIAGWWQGQTFYPTWIPPKDYEF